VSALRPSPSPFTLRPDHHRFAVNLARLVGFYVEYDTGTETLAGWR
jgi:hypothetical protein